MDERPGDVKYLWCYFVMLRFGKYGKRQIEENWDGFESVCRVLHGLDVSLFGGDRAKYLTGDENDFRHMSQLERLKYVEMPARERRYMKIVRSKWRHFNNSLEKEGRMNLWDWNRALELQAIIWKLAGVEGTFGKYIIQPKYKDSLADWFFDVRERLLEA